MNKERPYLEQNTAQLIRAAYGPSARPSADARERAFQLVLNQVRTRPAKDEFPDIAVIILSVVLVFIAAWLGFRVTSTATSFLASPLLLATLGWLVLNLAILPVASIVIVTRRRNG